MINTTYHKNDINLNAKPKFKNQITIIGSTSSNNKTTGIDSKKVSSNNGVKPENKYYTRKFVTSTTTNASNVSRKSIDKASNTIRVKTSSNNNTNSNVGHNQTGSILQYYKRTIPPLNNKVVDNHKKNTIQSSQTTRLSSKPYNDSSFKKDNKIIEKENYNNKRFFIVVKIKL